MAHTLEQAFKNMLRERYKGKVYKINRTFDVELVNIVKVQVEFHIPTDEADELEMYRRIAKVINVIAEGGDDG